MRAATQRWGRGRVIPDRVTCPTRPLERLEKCPDPYAADGQDIRRALEEDMTTVAPHHLLLLACPSGLVFGLFFLLSQKKFPLAVFSSTFPRLFQPLSLKCKCLKMQRGKTPRSWES